MVCIFLVALIFLVSGIFLQIFLKLTTEWCRSHTCLVGKTAIVTGANRGIGYEAALDLAKRGAKVILACRDRKAAKKARSRIIQQTGNTNIYVKNLNLDSFASVKTFVSDIKKHEQRLDILVNNAGVFFTESVNTGDALISTMQINYFSVFLLTNLLLKLMKKSKSSRIVNVSSKAAYFAFNFDLNSMFVYRGHILTYCASKMALILFTRKLADKLKGTGVTVYSVHPGAVKTDLFRHGGNKLVQSFYEIISDLFYKTSEEGAQTIIHCAIARNIEQFSGEHFADCKVVSPYRRALDFKLSRLLWYASEKVVKLKNKRKFLCCDCWTRQYLDHNCQS